MRVAEFYAGKTVFVSGATGFIGKVFVEKVLRSCPDVKRIYFLIRGKKEKSPAERLSDELLKSQCFSRLRLERPDFDQWTAEVCHAIAGDISCPDLGICEADWQTLCNDVDICVNLAASVDFNLRLDQAVQQNVLGPLSFLKLCHEAKHLKSFVHVSTAYVNASKPDGDITEEVKRTRFDPNFVLQEILDVEDPEDFDHGLTKKFIRRHPNTYTFTKNMAEKLLSQRRGATPIAIVRPTCVGASYQEPFPGWVDTVSASGAVFLMAGLGILQVLPGKPANKGDNVPVDIVVNAIVAAAADIAERNTLEVYHTGSSHHNPITWVDCAKGLKDYWVAEPTNRLKESPKPYHFRIYPSWAVFYVTFFCLTLLPAWLYWMLWKIKGSPDSMRDEMVKIWKAIRRTKDLVSIFAYFCTHEWIFHADNLDRLRDRMHEDDREIFNHDVRQLDLQSWIRTFCWGLKTFVLKEAGGPNPLLPTASTGEEVIQAACNGEKAALREVEVFDEDSE